MILAGGVYLPGAGVKNPFSGMKSLSRAPSIKTPSPDKRAGEGFCGGQRPPSRQAPSLINGKKPRPRINRLFFDAPPQEFPLPANLPGT
jgi:hypothetical protein